jgi:hypothetical protein
VLIAVVGKVIVRVVFKIKISAEFRDREEEAMGRCSARGVYVAVVKNGVMNEVSA